MEYLEWIIKIGGTITAIILIWRTIVFFVHLADDVKEMKEHVAESNKYTKDIEEIKEHSKENYLTCLRLTIMSKDMPLGERMIAAANYLKTGGNGDMKKYIINELHFNDTQQK